MEDLRGRTAVVTGGASGIGLALAQRFLEQGMNVVVADVEAAALDEAVGRLERSGPVLGVPTDVSDRDQVFALASAAREAFGPVSVLCNNAGVGGASAGAAWERDPRDWEWIVGVNLWGVVHGVQAFVPDMVERDEGHVVNTASMAGLVMGGILSPYTTTKHAVVGLSKSMYSDLRMRGSHVGVTVLCPGWVRTRIGESARNWPRRLGPPPEPRSGIDLLASGPGAQLIAGGMDPAEVAALVLGAVREQRFWLLPNAEEMLPGLRQQTDGMLAGTNPDIGPLG
jgi:NAD(P)-dependent dehydrogenase (short-subunit alcohol dehydrogenase family)